MYYCCICSVDMDSDEFTNGAGSPQRRQKKRDGAKVGTSDFGGLCTALVT